MAVDMFIKIADIKGEATDDKHKDEIDVLSWSWGMTQSGSMHHGGGGGSGKVNVQDLSFTKYIDKASPNLMKFCCSGKHFKDAMLTVRKAGDKPLEYIIVKLTDVLITSVSTGGSGGQDKLTENVTLNFAAVKLAYQPQKKDGAKDGGPVEMGWNIEANTELK
jgi:type VI secretion system secreted protein Hcp